MDKSLFKFGLITNDEADRCIANAAKSIASGESIPKWKAYSDAVSEREAEEKLGVVFKTDEQGRKDNGDWCKITIYYGADGERLEKSGNGQGFCPPFCNKGDA